MINDTKKTICFEEEVKEKRITRTFIVYKCWLFQNFWFFILEKLTFIVFFLLYYHFVWGVKISIWGLEAIKREIDQTCWIMKRDAIYSSYFSKKYWQYIKIHLISEFRNIPAVRRFNKNIFFWSKTFYKNMTETMKNIETNIYLHC